MEGDKNHREVSSLDLELLLPVELLMCIVKLCAGASLYDVLKISQTCRLFRDIALPPALETLSPVDNVGHLMRLPTHLHQYVHNLWISDTRKERIEGIEKAWFWYTVRNIALPPELYLQDISIEDIPPADGTPPLASVKLTLTPMYDDAILDGDGDVSCSLLANSSSYASRVTHIWVDSPPAIMQSFCVIFADMQALTHVAVAYRRFAHNAEWAASTLCASAAWVRDRKAVMVGDSVMHINADFLVRMAKPIMAAVKGVYFYATGGVETEDVRAEWEGVIEGEEDIWTKAERIRKAVFAEDRDEVMRICGEDYIRNRLKRIARGL